MSQTFEEWWTQNGHGYVTVKDLARDAWFGAAQMYAVVPSSTDAKLLLGRAIELVLEDWPEDHPSVVDFLKDARSLVSSPHESDQRDAALDEAVNILFDELGTLTEGEQQAVERIRALKRQSAPEERK